MREVTVRVDDLKAVLSVFKDFVYEDHYSCDRCSFCGMRYGNAKLMIADGERLTHKEGCPVLVAQDLSTGLYPKRQDSE